MDGRFRVGAWVVDPELGTIAGEEGSARLEPRTMQVLVYLAEHAGRVVSKDAIFQEVWDGAFVTDEALTNCISNLRRALGDSAKEPRVIQTVPKKGYRLIAPVVSAAAPEAERRERNPYPGLEPFGEADTERFFGREEEVEILHERVGRSSMLALIGPSGVGKSSLLRAGLIPSLPASWGVILCRPGESPFTNLGRALAPAFVGDVETTDQLFELDKQDVGRRVLSRWKSGKTDALVVLDQFEELFTLSSLEVQERFAELLGAAVQSGVKVLVSLRDDFLMHCHRFAPLAPVFTELTPLGPPSGDALKRALVEPARARGVTFEDEALMAEMVEEVSEERGALPLLAFAAARLWERRDRETRQITRRAYEEIGGVGGALAQHAEATLERIGIERQGIVREIFRNLTTAKSTRASREREELLSLFEDREDAAAVLNALIDARLLTSFEERVEIVHESLLSAWPRLARWQTQDADSAQLRDQLRQAARLWEERERPDDLLWSGTSYRELELWRERYAGALTSVEEAFARAMTTRALRRKRYQRLAVTATIAAVLVVVAVVGSLWQLALRAAREAEAAELLGLGRLQLEENPTAALAYALASLELSDNEPARRFAVEALWKGPMVTVVPDPHGINYTVPAFSPDGRWLAMGGTSGLVAYDGQRNELHPLDTETTTEPVAFTSDGSRLLTNPVGLKLDLWSLVELERILRWPYSNWVDTAIVDERLVSVEHEGPDGPLVVRERSLESGDELSLGPWRGGPNAAFDPRGEWIVSVEEGQLVQRRMDALDEPPRLLGRADGKVRVRVNPGTRAIVTADTDGRVRLWDAESGHIERELASPADARHFVLDPTGRFLVTAPGILMLRSGSFYAFDLGAPRGTSPIPLLYDQIDALNGMTFHPARPILASGNYPIGVLLWNLGTPRPIVLREQRGPSIKVAFTPDGRLVSVSDEGVARLWPLWTDPDAEVRVLRARPGVERLRGGVEVASDGSFAVVQDRAAKTILVLPLDGRPNVVYDLGQRGQSGGAGSLSPDGRLLALRHGESGRPETASLRLFDLETGDERRLYPDDTRDACIINSPGNGAVQFPRFLPDGRLITEGALGLRLWDLALGTSRQLRPCRAMTEPPAIGATPDSRFVLVLDIASETFHFTAFDLETEVTQPITWHGNQVTSFALDPTGKVLVTGSADGTVRVSKLWGGDPHLLYGHAQAVRSLAVSPDGKWIASAGDDDTIRLWNMPDVTKPPLHTLPYEELLARLREFTNLRVAPDEDSATGFALSPGPFHGWNNLPQGW